MSAIDTSISCWSGSLDVVKQEQKCINIKKKEKLLLIDVWFHTLLEKYKLIYNYTIRIKKKAGQVCRIEKSI